MKSILLFVFLITSGLYAQDLVPYRKGDKWGFADRAKKVVIEPQFDAADIFSGGLACVRTGHDYAFIRPDGSYAIAPGTFYEVEDAMMRFREGRAAVRRGEGRYVFIDREGRVISKRDYFSAQGFSDGRALFNTGLVGGIGYIDTSGTEIIAAGFGFGYDFENGFAHTGTELYGFIDKQGKRLTPEKFDQAFGFSEGLAAIRKGDKWGFIDAKGKEVIPCKYEEASLYGIRFSEGLACVKFDGKVGFIDKKGKTVIPFHYEEGYSFSEGLAAVKQDGKIGFVDKKGTLAIPFSYEFTMLDGECRFSEGLAAVQDLSGSIGFINAKGEEIIPFQFSNIGAIEKNIPGFRNGIARVESAGGWIYIDKNGEAFVAE